MTHTLKKFTALCLIVSMAFIFGAVSLFANSDPSVTVYKDLVRFSATGNISVQISDLSGRTIFSKSADNALDWTTLQIANGVYLYTISAGDKKRLGKLIVIAGRGSLAPEQIVSQPTVGQIAKPLWTGCANPCNEQNNGDVSIATSAGTVWAKFDSTNQRLGIGTTTPGSTLSLFSTAAFQPQVEVRHSGTTQAYFNLGRARTGTTAVQSGDNLGQLIWQGYANGGWNNASSIAAFVDGAPSGSNVPSNLVFYVSNTTSQLTERMRIDNAGNVGIGTASPNEQVEITGNLRLPSSTASVGVIKSGADRFIHNFGTRNFFAGVNAGNLSLTGTNNTGVGVDALGSNTTGNYNMAVGEFALRNNSTGSLNTAAGDSALNFNITGTNNTALGAGADVSASNLTNATAIGAGAIVNASNKVRIGNTSVTVIEGQVGFTSSSDVTKKENFLPVDGREVLQKISQLSITSWNFKGQDPKEFRHYGPYAQEFFAAFGHDSIGTIGTPTTITSTDMDGILMISVQTLYELSLEKDKMIEQLTQRLDKKDREIEQLQQRIAKLEKLIQGLIKR